VLPWGRVGIMGEICLECSNNLKGMNELTEIEYKSNRTKTRKIKE
jgi:hypothetical protein